MKRIILLSLALLSLGYAYPDGTRIIKVGDDTYVNARFEMTRDGLGVSDRRGCHSIKFLSLSKEDIGLFLPMSMDVKGKHMELVQICGLTFTNVHIIDRLSSHPKVISLEPDEIPHWLCSRLGLYSDPINKIK